MRILFYGPGTSTYLPEIRLPNTSGLRHSITDRLIDLKDTKSLTSNRGNLEAEDIEYAIRHRVTAETIARTKATYRIRFQRFADTIKSHGVKSHSSL